MAKDADNNYYYDEGTIAEQFDNWEVYEDEDGNVGFYNGTGELRMQDLAFVIGGARSDPPTTDELASGEYMIYVDDADFQMYVAVNDGGSSIETEAITAFTIDNL
jgi:hypothetical protein